MTVTTQHKIDTLKRARTLLGEGEHRWTRNDLYSYRPTGKCFCMLGALAEVTTFDEEIEPFSSELRKTLKEALGVLSVAGANDYYLTYEGALAVFDATIVRLESEVVS